MSGRPDSTRRDSRGLVIGSSLRTIFRQTTPRPAGSRCPRGAVWVTAILLLVPATQPARAQTGVFTLSGGSATETNQTYTATLTDQSSVYVLNSGHLTLNTCTMQKTGDSSNLNNSSQYGLNAAILATTSSSIILNGGSVTSNASGANGLFATGSSTTVNMTNGTITTGGDLSHGVDVTYGGTITLYGVNITTTGASSSALATDFGGGTVNVTGGTISASNTSQNSHSAGIYSTGSISVSGASVTSLGDCGGVIDGANSITLTNTALSGVVEGIKIWRTAPGSGTATVTITGGSLSSSDGDGFYCTGSSVTAALTLKGGATVRAGTGNMVNVNTSAVATLTVVGSSPSGNLVADATSTLSTVLQSSSMLTGTATGAALSIGSTSEWTVTGTSTLTVLTDPTGISGLTMTNIIGNGNVVYYNSALAGNSCLQGRTYTLVNGGILTPSGGASVNPGGMPGFVLAQNQPNPFSGATSIGFQIPSRSYVSLRIYDPAGRQVATLVDGLCDAGSHQAAFVAGALPSGVYYCRLLAGGRTQSRSLIIER